jgi:iron complex outermembrane receptor protein
MHAGARLHLSILNALSMLGRPDMMRMALAAAMVFASARMAQAQRASENAVTQAEDAFGTSVGNEQVGLYSSYDVRGFSPTAAGNVRIEGLYFDQATDLNPRLQQSSQIRVGIAAQGYAFPAPTGVVDYTLRLPGAEPRLSALVESNTRGTTRVEFDGAHGLIEGRLSIAGGVGFHRDVLADGSANYEHNEAVLLKWTPLENVNVMPFWSRTDYYDKRSGQTYAPAGPFLPAFNPGRHFFGPDWALGREFDSNYGVVARITPFADWDLKVGLFRSEKKEPDSMFVLLSNLDRDGNGHLRVFADPPSGRRSTSGEVRLEHTVQEGPRLHRAIFSVRMRDRDAEYGGAAIINLGATAIGERISAQRPDFHFSPQIRDHVEQTTIGFSYQLAWKGLGVLGLGVQRPSYHKRTLIPGQQPAISDDQPWLFDASLAAEVLEDVTVYGDFTRGLEDSEIAPQNASNRNQALPAITTRQKDVGLRWAVTPGVKLVFGLFDIQKPYFNINPQNLYTQLGEIQNKGIEISLAGNVLAELDVVAGAVLAEPRVQGDAVDLGLVGRHPVGMPSRQLDVNFNWRPPQEQALSFNLGVSYQSSVPAVVSNLVSVSDRTVVNGDVRYSFVMGGYPASLKFGIQNLFDSRDWDLDGAGAYNIYWDSGRRLNARLIVDF